MWSVSNPRSKAASVGGLFHLKTLSRRQNGVTAEARRFVFSINHTHIRLLNPTEWGDVGFVIFQFENSRKGARKAIPHFDNGIKFWADTEIGGMIDEIYRILDEIRRAA
jgi:hypothetical protein